MYELRLDGMKVRRMRRTDEGFLDIWGVASVRGVLEYKDPPRRELVTDEAQESSLATLRAAPVTLEHPAEGEVTPTNARRLGRGHVVEADYDKEAGEVRVRIRVEDQDAIEEILDRRTIELSPAYRADIDETPGTHDEYGDYDVVQTSRTVNHLALTQAGRAGEAASVRVDSLLNEDNMENGEDKTDADAPAEDAQTEDGDKPKMDAEEAMKAIAESLEEIKSMLSGREDEDMPEREDEDGEDMPDREDEEHMNKDSQLAWFRDRRRALDAAAQLDLDVDEDAAENVDIKRAVVGAYHEDSMRLDGKSDDYVDAAFDHVVASLDKDEANKPDPFARASAHNRATRADSADKEIDFSDARRAWASSK